MGQRSGQPADFRHRAAARFEAQDRATGVTARRRAAGDDQPRARRRDRRIAQTQRQPPDDRRARAGPPREDRVERFPAVVAAHDVRGGTDRGDGHVRRGLGQVTRDGHAAACGVEAQDVVIGFDLAATEHIHSPSQRSGLSVVLSFGQSRSGVGRGGAPRGGGEHRDRGGGGIFRVQSTEQHDTSLPERGRGGVFERRGQRARASRPQPHGKRPRRPGA